MISINFSSNTSNSNHFEWDIPDLVDLSKKRKLEDKEKSDQDDLELFEDSESDNEWNENKKLKTQHERNELSKLRETQLRQKEIELSNTDRIPQDENDFEMALVASPNSSLVWLKYISFFLERGETAKAREIAERALQKISFRLKCSIF